MLEIFGGAVRPVPALIDGNVDLLGLSVSKQRLVLPRVRRGADDPHHHAASKHHFGRRCAPWPSTRRRCCRASPIAKIPRSMAF